MARMEPVLLEAQSYGSKSIQLIAIRPFIEGGY